MPGEDFAEAVRVVTGQLDGSGSGFAFLPELPARGATARMVGRTLAFVTDLGIDLQPAGWRLTDSSGIDHGRAQALLRRDLDTLEELTQGYHGRFKIQLTGPWSLAAMVERPRGDKVLADYGARRDLAQALAAGLSAHVDEVRRRLGGVDLVVQVDEPMLPRVLAGQVSTASGFSRHRSVTDADAAATVDWIFDVIHAAHASSVLHCCASGVPFAMLRQTAAQAVSFDLSQVSTSEYDEVATWVEAQRAVWLGAVPAVDPAGTPPGDADLIRRIVRWWSALGYDDAEGQPTCTITPTCGHAGASPRWARHALGLTRSVADGLSVEQGKMGA